MSRRTSWLYAIAGAAIGSTSGSLAVLAVAHGRPLYMVVAAALWIGWGSWLLYDRSWTAARRRVARQMRRAIVVPDDARGQ